MVIVDEVSVIPSQPIKLYPSSGVAVIVTSDPSS